MDYLGKESRGAEVDRQARLLHYCSGKCFPEEAVNV